MPRRGESIYKRKDGRWEGRYKSGVNKDGSTRYVSVYGKTYAEVKDKKSKALLNIATNSKSSKNTTLNVLLFEWFSFNCNQIKPSSAQKYEALIRNHIHNGIGKMMVSDISRSVLSIYAQEMLLNGNVKCGGALSPRTVNSILTIIGSAMKWRSDGRYSFTMPFLKEIHSVPQTLTVTEQIKLETYIKDNFNVFTLGMLFSLYTGMRIGEICALDWEDITDDVIFVHKTMQRIKSSDGHWRIVITEPKTQNAIRFIPLSAQLKYFLKDYSSLSGYVLLQKNGNFVEPRLLQKWVGKVFGQIGMPQRTFHSLRHTFATRLIEQGCDPKTASAILGHSNVQITLNRYVHPSLDLKKKAINKIESPYIFDTEQLP